jgi:hypothetical protein
MQEFPDIGDMRVLDIGGEARFWQHREVRPLHVTMLNVFYQETKQPWITAVAGDGCELPDELRGFDLVFSNSVIEHVGGHWRRAQLAEQIRAAGDRYWVQTPNRFFPIEPHVLFPFFQHLPRRAQAEVIVRWRLGNFSEFRDRSRAVGAVLEFDLLSRCEMAYYFPDADLIAEKLVGLTKSWIAVKR